MNATGLVVRFGKDFLFAHITIPYHVNGNVVLIRGKAMDGKYLTPPGSKTRLYNLDALWGASTACISEGEFDALVLEQLGFDAVGQPGANVWQDSMTGYFDEVKRVHIIFDNDSAGRAGSEKVAKAFGPKAKIVTTLLPETEKNDKNDISELVINKGWMREDFEFMFVKARGGLLITVDDAYQEWLEIQSAEGIKLGYKMIDDQLAPGILPGQVLVTLAKSGSGKTVSMLNMFERMKMAKPDIKILFVSLEQTRGDWFERAHRIHRFYDLQATVDSTLSHFRDNLIMMDKNMVTEEELIQSIEQYEFEMGSKPDVVAVDYLGYWARGYAGESYERTSKAIMAMKRVAKDLRIPFITPHQLSRGTAYGEEPDIDTARDSGVIVETADFVISLWSPDQKRGSTREDRGGVVNMKIGKSRHGGVGTVCHMQFAPYSLVMIPEFDAMYEAAQHEHHRFSMGDTYDQVLADYAHGVRWGGNLNNPDEGGYDGEDF
jgi:KaiC/GvpD/RAD55 family RecA-like ATPase